MPAAPSAAALSLARQARERFVAHAETVLPKLSDDIRTRLIELVDGATSTREMQELRDVMFEFDKVRGAWVDGTRQAWRKALEPATVTARVRPEGGGLTLIGDDVVENKILSSRLAMAVQEKAVWEINDLRLRIQHLEGVEEMGKDDILQSEALAQLMVEQWVEQKLARETWMQVKDIIHPHMIGQLLAGYRLANEFLIAKGVLPDIEQSVRVKRAPSGGSPRRPPPGPNEPPPETAAGDLQQGGPQGGYNGGYGGGQGYAGAGGGNHAGSQGGGWGGAQGGGHPGGSQGGYPGGGGDPSMGAAQGAGPGNGGWVGGGGHAGGYEGGGYAGSGSAGAYRGDGAAGGSAQSQAPGGRAGGNMFGRGAPGAGAGGGHDSAAYGYGAGPSGPRGPGAASGAPGDEGGYAGPAGSGGGSAGGAGSFGVHDETRMQTASTPLARARARASGVLGQLKRLLNDKVTGYDVPHVGGPSPALAEAMSQHATHVQTHVQSVGTMSADGGEIVIFDDAAVEEVALNLRQRSVELKKKASTSSEKATIEIVALMFQSILAEERIPAAVRVWFARLQIPVLRVAIAEPEFFSSLEHPARQLIDRMGSCVLGFDAASIGGTTLETEIKRVVQVIEQYPETGRRVFQLVYDEFQKFLSKFLTEKGPTQQLVSIAQQVEEKETLAVQYTIEMRKLLSDVPVRDEIREFLFKVWAEVLAVAAVKNGPQHADTIALKKSAADLVWAAGAKPNRAERTKVIAELPKLLVRLRQGMTLMGIEGPEQEAQIKTIGDTLADAFLSKTEAIPHERIEQMAKRLANLEDFVSDDPTTDLPLDKDSIELMLGIDASMIEVIAAGGSQPSAAMQSWALELQSGNWFTLDHNGKITHVQYVWRSDRRQLHLFAAHDGRSFLIQLRRLAAYLQAGLLVPQEEEALTVRATREALAKLEANPERLVQ
ncbi:DUF1631 family protein [Ramlibacter sp.]|uniref:DUF1631 family protein n=1 Tax=Ramlibacter sp. TaxID=1917967 RepID=UPI003D1057F2